ncbi:hypothetical protein EDB89DRAFT_1940181 [Lactarius sanguifluus]|nr:hypothetical protein EDB89DRAFT_1940181 [Lactarius sanguifluus]
MTRYTNAGRKRTYLQASFDPIDHETLTTAASASGLDSSDPLQVQQEARVGTSPEPSRKRRRRSKTMGTISRSLRPRKERNGPKKVPAADRAAASETRRLKRKVERCANTTCFACREVGHSAKDCPSILPGTGDGATKTTTKNLIGICYRCAIDRLPPHFIYLKRFCTRCGSRMHNLARCRKPPEQGGSLPFASCFVCSGQGHLASSCPDNNGKGVYPNGGSCKLCGETTHLAKDCTLRTKTGQWGRRGHFAGYGSRGWC